MLILSAVHSDDLGGLHRSCPLHVVYGNSFGRCVLSRMGLRAKRIDPCDGANRRGYKRMGVGLLTAWAQYKHVIRVSDLEHAAHTSHYVLSAVYRRSCLRAGRGRGQARDTRRGGPAQSDWCGFDGDACNCDSLWCQVHR